MKVLVVYESMFGNTEEVARAIAAGIGESAAVTSVDVVAAADARGRVGDADLVVIGGPTHAFSMTRESTRTDAVSQGATGETSYGLRDLVDDLPRAREGQKLAVFDTRVTKVRHLPGSAARSAWRHVRRHGYQPAASPESFYVLDVAGPLEHGEIERATSWGRRLALSIVGVGEPH
jgi:hypothetical protein